LQKNPDKTVWVANWDAPNFPPTDAQINENLVVLFLAGLTFNTEREPLAWIGKAATGDTQAFPPQVGTTRAVQAWKTTIDQAARNAGVAARPPDHLPRRGQGQRRSVVTHRFTRTDVDRNPSGIRLHEADLQHGRTARRYGNR
jgi:hypothetical protein